MSLLLLIRDSIGSDNFSDDELAERDVKFEIRALSPAKRLKELVREVENKVSIFIFFAGGNELGKVSGGHYSHS